MSTSPRERGLAQGPGRHAADDDAGASVTQQYPDVKPELPPRSRGVIALLEENCTVCMLCARECPDWCIYIDSHKETIPAPPGGRERQRNVLDRFAIDFSLCMYCGICIEVCPFDALFWSPEFEYAELDIRDLTHEKDRLGEWMRDRPAAAGARRPRRARQGGRRPAAVKAAGRGDRERGVSVVEVLFGLLGVVALGSALLVVTTRQLVHAALWLVVCLGAVAGCYLLLSAEFVAWVQVLIYVGAVVVLLLFGLMLTRAPIGVSRRPRRAPLQRVLAAVVAAGLAAVVVADRRGRVPRRAASSSATTTSAARRAVGRRGHLPRLGAAVRGAVGAAARRAGRRDRAVPTRHRRRRGRGRLGQRRAR